MTIISEFMSKFYKNSIKSMMSEKKMAVLVICFSVLFLVPMFIVGAFSHPTTDDYTYGLTAYRALQNNDGISAIFKMFKSAWETAPKMYKYVSGYYTGSFLASLRPNIISDNLTFLNSFFILSSFIFGIFYICTNIAKYIFSFSKYYGLIISSILLFPLIQLIPSSAEMFYWYTAGITYVFLFVIAWSIIVEVVCVMRGKKITKGLYIRTIIFTLLAGGGILPVNIPALAVLLFLCIDIIFIKKYSKTQKRFIITIFSIYLLTSLIGAFAPGNFQRLESLESKQSIIGALIYSCYGVFQLVKGFLMPLILIIGMIIAGITVYYMPKTKYEFAHPFFATLVWYCVMVAAYFPIYFGTKLKFQYVDGRYKSLLFFYFVLGFYFLVIYYTGWLYKRLEKRSALILIGFAYLFLLATFAAEQPRELWSVRTVKDFQNGNIQQYNQEMQERISQYHDSNLKEITITHASVKPLTIYLQEPIDGAGNEWIINAIKEYYNKDKIHIIQ